VFAGIAWYINFQSLGISTSS